MTSSHAQKNPQKIERASADFSQETFPIANAIDNKLGSGWAIHPEVGKPHHAIFELSEPIRLKGQPAPLTITLAFNSNRTLRVKARPRPMLKSHNSAASKKGER